MNSLTLPLLAALGWSLAPAALAQEFQDPSLGGPVPPGAPAPATAQSPAAFGGDLLGIPFETHTTREIPVRPFMPRTRVVSINGDVLDSLARRDDESGARFDLELFPGRTVTLRPTKLRETRANSFVMSGDIAGDRLGHFTLASEKGFIAANIRTGDGKVFSLRHLENGLHWMAEIDEAALPACGTPDPVPGSRPGQGEPAQPESTPETDGEDPEIALLGGGEQIDVLVVYTPSARNAAGGALAMNAAIEVAIEEGDDALSLSGVSADMNLVGIMELDYSESSASFGTHLDRMTDPFDGSIDQIVDWRAACGADMVAMIVNDSDGGTLCGLAWVKPGILLFPPILAGPFSVNDFFCLPGLTLIHEFGRNMGCQHDSVPSGSGSFDGARGFNFTCGSGTAWRTILARNSTPGNRILRYSNPFVTFDGIPTGVSAGVFGPQGNNNAGAIHTLSGQIQSYFGSVPKLSSVFVDFNTLIPIQDGSGLLPYNLLGVGLLRAADNGLVTLRGNGPVNVPRIAQDVRLSADSCDVDLCD